METARMEDDETNDDGWTLDAYAEAFMAAAERIRGFRTPMEAGTIRRGWLANVPPGQFAREVHRG